MFLSAVHHAVVSSIDWGGLQQSMFRLCEIVILTVFLWDRVRREISNLPRPSQPDPLRDDHREPLPGSVGDDLDAMIGDLIELLSRDELPWYTLCKELPSCLFWVLVARFLRKRRRRKP